MNIGPRHISIIAKKFGKILKGIERCRSTRAFAFEIVGAAPAAIPRLDPIFYASALRTSRSHFNRVSVIRTAPREPSKAYSSSLPDTLRK